MKKLSATLLSCLVACAVGVVLTVSLTADAQMPAQLTAFSQEWQRVVPHDTNELPRQPRAIMLDADGGVAMLGWGSSGACVTMELFGGQIYPLSPRKICDTGTDASSVLVIY